jgi:hypothetical protein
MTKSSSSLPHPKWVHDPAAHTQMAPPRGPLPITRAASLHRVLAAWVARDPVLVPVSPTALGQAARMEWAVAAREAAPAPARESRLALDPVVAAAAPVAVAVAAPVAGLGLVPATLLALAVVISPPEVVGTRSRVGGD